MFQLRFNYIYKLFSAKGLEKNSQRNRIMINQNGQRRIVMQINEKFYMLPKEKQQIIINAGLECFGQYGYQKANTERIALKAGISKALLFHYFINKKNFYLFLCDFCKEVSADLLDVDEMLKITDFFELVDFSMQTKWKIMTKYPYLTNFALNAFYSQEEKTTSDVNKYIETELNNSFDTYFRNIDFSKFKENVEPKYIYHMLVMLSEGYLSEKQRTNSPIIFDEAVKELKKWQNILKQASYKEEYL